MNPRSLSVKNLMPGLVERGKIKIGIKGAVRKSQKGTDWQPPVKLDHFLITTLERDQDGNFKRDEAMHKLYGEKPRILPVRLIYNDMELNWQTRYCAYAGRTLWCSGDGEEALRLVRNTGADKQQNPYLPERAPHECPCLNLDADYPAPSGPTGPKCKINGTLSVILDGAESVGSVWKLRTTSFNSCVGITSSLALISRITGGPVSGLPLRMTLTSKTSEKGQIYVVGLEFAGTVEKLREISYGAQKQESLYVGRILQLEDLTKKMLSKDLDTDSPEDVTEEWYPEQAEAEAHKPNGEVLDVECSPVADKPVEVKPAPAETKPAREARAAKTAPETTAPHPDALLNDAAIGQLKTYAKSLKIGIIDVLRQSGCQSFETIPVSKRDELIAWIDAQAKAKMAPAVQDTTPVDDAPGW